MSVFEIFADAQKSSINHRSLTKRLRKIESKYENNRSQFEEQVKQCVLRCLEVTKSERAGQNIVKFLCTYCAAIQRQEQENDNEDGGDEEEEEDSNSLTSQILIMMLPHMSVKDKVVRYRATQIISQLMGIIQEIDDEVYQAIRHELSKRVRDKVPAIRLEAVCALGRLLENEMEEEAQAAEENDRASDEDADMLDDDYEERESAGLLDRLLDVLSNDTNSDVRKALLMNLPIEPKTLPFLLERARDKDAGVRRALYSKLMPNLGDFRHLSLSMREKLLRWGLRDRDERVRKAAARMFSTLWIEQVAKTRQQADAEADSEELPRKRQVGFYEPDLDALHELLERIDIMNAGQDDGVGPEAMREFWTIREDYFDTVVFDDDFFSKLTVESAFMARTFYDYCATNPDKQLQAAEEQRLPEVTRFGYHLQHYLQGVIELRSQSEEEVDEEAQSEQEFICEQLLHIAHTLDYTDEIGRRKMFSLLRQMIAIADLPEEITKLAIEALRLTCTSDQAGEKEFIAVVQEAIAEVQDVLNEDDPTENGTNREHSPADDESFVSAQSELSTRSDETARPSQSTSISKKTKNMTPEEAEAYHLHTVLIQLKCLSISHTLLQNITSDITTNISLETLLNTLIIPAVRSTDAPIRERAIECLGLACLLSGRLWRNNRELFVYCLGRGHEELRIGCLRILNDCIATHHQMSRGPDEKEGEKDVAMKELLQPFIDSFGYNAEVQSCATMCVAKLMMCGFYKPIVSSQENEENTQEEQPEAEADPFELAIEEATLQGTKGWELLAKVKAALLADATGKGQARDEHTERRQS